MVFCFHFTELAAGVSKPKVGIQTGAKSTYRNMRKGISKSNYQKLEHVEKPVDILPISANSTNKEIQFTKGFQAFDLNTNRSRSHVFF